MGRLNKKPNYMTVPATIKELKKYDEATDKLKSLLEKKKALQTEGLMNAVMKSSRFYEEILRYIQSDSFEEQEL